MQVKLVLDVNSIVFMLGLMFYSWSIVINEMIPNTTSTIRNTVNWGLLASSCTLVAKVKKSVCMFKFLKL